MSRRKNETDEEYKKRRRKEYEHYHAIKQKREKENAIALGIYIKDCKISDRLRKDIEDGKIQILVDEKTGEVLRFRKKVGNGYWVNNSPTVHKGIIYLHREKLRRYLSLTEEQMKGYEVHHIDGNIDNNDITNLRLMTVSEHQKLHAVRSENSKRHVCRICGRTYYSSVSGSIYICNRCL